MASKVEEFVSAPCEDLLNDLTKDQLVELAGHYKINLVSQDKRLKDNIISLVKTELIKRGVLESQFRKEFVATSTMSQLTFEQQKQLLLIQTEMKEKLLEAQNRVEMSKVQLQQQLDLERYRLDLIRDGKLPLTGGVERDLASCKSDVVTNMRLIPRFDEKDVERFFLLFERVAEARNWPDEECTLMCSLFLQTKLKKRIRLLVWKMLRIIWLLRMQCWGHTNWSQRPIDKNLGPGRKLIVKRMLSLYMIFQCI